MRCTVFLVVALAAVHATCVLAAGPKFERLNCRFNVCSNVKGQDSLFGCNHVRCSAIPAKPDNAGGRKQIGRELVYWYHDVDKAQRFSKNELSALIGLCQSGIFVKPVYRYHDVSSMSLYDQINDMAKGSRFSGIKGLSVNEFDGMKRAAVFTLALECDLSDGADPVGKFKSPLKLRPSEKGEMGGDGCRLWNAGTILSAVGLGGWDMLMVKSGSDPANPDNWATYSDTMQSKDQWVGTTWDQQKCACMLQGTDKLVQKFDNC